MMRKITSKPHSTNRTYLFCLSQVALLVAAFFLGASTLSLGQAASAGMIFPQYNSSYIAGTPIHIQNNITTPANTTITNVDLYYDTNFFSSAIDNPTTGTLIVANLAPPYSYTWTPPTPTTPARSYFVRAVVTNVNASNVTSVAFSNVTVKYVAFSVYRSDYSTAPRKIYVSPTGTNVSPYNSLSTAATTIQRAADIVAPGDTVFVAAGPTSYTSNSTNIVSIQRTGLPNKWITFRPYQNDKPVLQMGNNNWQAFNVLPAAAYIKIQGFEVIGNNANITLAQAQAQPGSCESGPASATLTPIARFNGNGISITGTVSNLIAGRYRPHHVVIANNYIHDCAGGGVGPNQADYVTIEDNTLANNSWYTVYGTSGISVFNSWNFDNSTDIKMIVRRNKSYGNMLKIAWNIGGTGTNCRFYDGNGIILDNNNAAKNPNGTYTGKFLVENNLCYLNGGRGINVNFTDNASVINNTTYQNGVTNQTTYNSVVYAGIESEIIAQGGSGLDVYNNIFYGRTGEKNVDIAGTMSNVVHNNNLTYEGTGVSYFTGAQNITGQDPLFIDAGNGNFQLASTSPALNAGSSLTFAAADLRGVTRPQGTSVDIGAFETPAISAQPASSSIVCIGTPVSVSVGVNGGTKTYQWYKNGVAITDVASATTATLSLPNVTTTNTGSYSVVVVATFASSMTTVVSLTSTAFNLTVNPPPSLSVGSPLGLTLTCTNPSLTLTATSSVTNLLWSDASTATTLAVSTSGTYSVTATSDIGCTAVASTTLTANQTTPIASLLSGSATLSCTNPSVTLVAGANLPGVTYAFSGGGTPLGSNSLVVTNVGTYSVTVTGANGCSAVASTSISQDNSLPTLNVSPGSGVLTCTNPSLTLTAASSVTNLLWSDNSTATTLAVSTSGTYSVTATAPNGCTISSSVSVSINKTAPTPNLLPSSVTLTCANPSVTLVAGANLPGATYAFSGGGTPLGSNNLVVTSAGTYSVLVTAANGCTASTTATITSNTAAPTNVSLTSGTLTCTQPSLTLTATSAGGTSYLLHTGQTSVSGQFVVNQPGTYTVTAINGNGCSATATATISLNDSYTFAVSPVQTSQRGSLSGGGSVTITVQVSDAYSYTLTGNNGFSVTSLSGTFIISQAGLYSVMIQNSTGCLTNTTVNVQSPVPPLVPGTFIPTNMLTCPLPGQTATAGLGAVVMGDAFVITGPDNYVFSSVYRQVGLYNLNASGITTPGAYTLTILNEGIEMGVYTANVTSDCTSGKVGGAGLKSGVSGPELTLTLSGNPTADEFVTVTIGGAFGQQLQLEVVDAKGTVIDQKQVSSAAASEQQRLRFGTRKGSIYVKISTPTAQRTIWIAR